MQVKILSLVIATVLLAGCSAKSCNGKLCPPVGSEVERKQMIVKKPEIRISPIVGTRSEESRIVRDFGVIQRAWIAPYSDQDGNLVASHDIYVVIREPRWIPGEELPKQATTLRPPAGGIPFHFKSEAIDSNVDLKNDQTIKDFINEVYEKDTNSSLTAKQLEELKKFDKSIDEFIKEKE